MATLRNKAKPKMGRKKVEYKVGEISHHYTENKSFTGNVYIRKGAVTSVETRDKVVKSANSFGSVKRAEKALEAYKELGLSGSPSSPSSIFRKVLDKKINDGDVIHPWQVRPDVGSLDTSGACWLWIERACPPGTEFVGQVNHYDLNEAFWSATKKGLPIKFFPYQSQDKNFVARCIINDTEKGLPYFFEKSLRNNRECLLTGKDIRYFGLDVEIIDALSYVDDYVDLMPVYETISKNFGPWTAKRARQQSWGTFVMKHGGVSGTRYEDGEKQKTWDNKNRFQNRLWGIIITRRIIRKVHKALTKGTGISCFVDSVLTLEKVDTGNDIGQWRQEGEYKDGIYMETPGIWTTRPKPTKTPSAEWTKHSGINSRKELRETEPDPRRGKDIKPMIPNDKLPWEPGVQKQDDKEGTLVPEDSPLEPNAMPDDPGTLSNALSWTHAGERG